MGTKITSIVITFMLLIGCLLVMTSVSFAKNSIDNSDCQQVEVTVNDYTANAVNEESNLETTENSHVVQDGGETIMNETPETSSGVVAEGSFICFS